VENQASTDASFPLGTWLLLVVTCTPGKQRYMCWDLAGKQTDLGFTSGTYTKNYVLTFGRDSSQVHPRKLATSTHTSTRTRLHTRTHARLHTHTHTQMPSCHVAALYCWNKDLSTEEAEALYRCSLPLRSPGGSD
jgi:hypothetical protein